VVGSIIDGFYPGRAWRYDAWARSVHVDEATPEGQAALPSMAYMGVIWSCSWLPLTVLILPATSIGYHIPGSALDDEGGQLFAIGVFVWGLSAGKAAGEKKLKELEAAK
jgi:hypothetical protein